MRLVALFCLAAASVFGADPFFFIQTTDPQFGMYADDRNFQQETANWEFVIANANRLHPAFMIVCGDLTNLRNDEREIAEYKRISAKLDASIRLYNVPGNHDVGNEPDAGTLAAYRRNFGQDYYSFLEDPIYGIVLDSSLMKAPGKVADEAAMQERWIEAELKKAQGMGLMPVIFMHIPLFLEKPDEPEQYFNLPVATRARLLTLFHRYGVRYVFAGHYHRNSFGRDGDLEMITSGPAGMPIGPDPSGIRIAQVNGGKIEQQYYPLGQIPNVFPAPPEKAK